MKKIILLLFAATFLIACDDDPDGDYIFYEMRYSLQTGDGQVNKPTRMPDQTYVNLSHSIQDHTFRLSDRSIETSWFEIDRDDLGLVAVNSPIYVYTPIAVINGKIELGNVEWQYTKDIIEYYEQEETVLTVPVGPYQEVVIKEEGMLEEITVTYTAVFVNPDTGDERLIRGKWMGNYYYRTDIFVEYYTLDK